MFIGNDNDEYYAGNTAYNAAGFGLWILFEPAWNQCLSNSRNQYVDNAGLCRCSDGYAVIVFLRQGQSFYR